MNLKKCINCKNYNSDRRNEEGLARCSKHPFWVKDDEVCESFETDEVMEEHVSGMKKITSLILAILFSLLWLIAFYLMFAVSALLFSLIFTLLINTPIINTLIDLWFHVRGDSPDMLMQLISPAIAYYTVGAISDKLVKNEEARRLSLLCTGVCLIVLNIISLVINLLSNASLFANIVVTITGVIFVIKNKRRR